MRKTKAQEPRISSPFDTTAYKLERTAVAILMHWMRDIIEKAGIDLGMPDVDTGGADGKSPDVVIYESRRSHNVLCVIEAKPPHFDVFNEKEIKQPAWQKANARRARYFGTTNFQELIWFNTEKVNTLKPLEEQVVDKYRLSELEDLNKIEDTKHKESITRQLEKFLKKLYAVSTGKEPEPKQAIDEFLIYRLHDKIRRLAHYYAPIIDDKCHKDASFRAQLAGWFADQGWSFGANQQDLDKAARQTAYLLVNKVLFYSVLQARRPNDLPPLRVPEDLLRGSHLRKVLQTYFDELLKIDYETIYTADFIDTVAFPDQSEVVQEIHELLLILRRYDFSKLGYEIVGGIFQKLIPQEERHNLGQYFTNPDVVDLILCFCLKSERDRVFDPACGAGTFLVRAYQHKKLMNQYLKHEDMLETLWGNDIAKFPAHLATINLAINDLSVDRNYPNIIQEDFFKLLTTEEGFDLPSKWRKARAKTLGAKEREVEYPRWFDCIVGNPPYTRQEEMAEIAPEQKEYKDQAIEKALQGTNGRKIADISRRAGIYAYFFVHGSKFLQNGGRFGFIVSESWLDVDYGKGLQEFFLNNYKITAIIGSKVERWFEDADINTCIIILEKCSGEDKRQERSDNLVRFVYLKKPLRHFIPAAQDIWEKQVERVSAIRDKFMRTVFAHSQVYEGEDFRIVPKKQSELWEEGFDVEQKEYTGSKWGKYLRAPEIFFKILEKSRGKLVPLEQVADVKFGIKTGANEFFYLTEEEIERRGIEKEFWMHKDKKGKWVPNYVIKSPRECKSIIVKPEDLKYRVLMIHQDKKDLKGKNVLKYIEEGEHNKYNLRPTCASRDKWYDLGGQEHPDLIWFKAFNDRVLAPLGSPRYFSSDRFYAVYVKTSGDAERILYALNSTLSYLFVELWGRVNLGEGALDNMTYETAAMPTLNPHNIRIKPSGIDKFCSRPIGSVFSELGADSPEEVSLDKVKPDRRALDRIVMAEILGLTDDEQLQVYRVVIDLVKSRLEKARSLDNNSKTSEGFDMGAMGNVVMERIKKDGYDEDHR